MRFFLNGAIRKCECFCVYALLLFGREEGWQVGLASGMCACGKRVWVDGRSRGRLPTNNDYSPWRRERVMLTGGRGD